MYQQVYRKQSFHFKKAFMLLPLEQYRYSVVIYWLIIISMPVPTFALASSNDLTNGGAERGRVGPAARGGFTEPESDAPEAGPEAELLGLGLAGDEAG